MREGDANPGPTSSRPSDAAVEEQDGLLYTPDGVAILTADDVQGSSRDGGSTLSPVQAGEYTYKRIRG